MTTVSPDKDQVEPTAYHKFWWKDGRPCCRVDMTDICEPWLDALKPTITPLYPRAAIAAMSPVDRLRKALEPFADAFNESAPFKDFDGRDCREIYCINGVSLSDFERAATALSSPEPVGEGE